MRPEWIFGISVVGLVAVGRVVFGGSAWPTVRAQQPAGDLVMESAPRTLVDTPITIKAGEASVEIEPPAAGERNLMWAALQCAKGDMQQCTLAANTMAALQASGANVGMCAVWQRKGKPKPETHCLDVSARLLEVDSGDK